jgi:hypothetical protein
MSYLLRVELPDVPGSLGRLATALGASGANIDAIEIVGRDAGAGTATDDVFIKPEPGLMPDSLVSACTSLDGVKVLWISRYAAGTNLLLDLEAVESMTDEPELALNTLVELMPEVFRVDWGVHVRRVGSDLEVLHRTSAAPSQMPADFPWPDGSIAQLGDLIVTGARIGPSDAVVMARRGGPAYLDSELARLRHLVALAETITRAGTPRSAPA